MYNKMKNKNILVFAIFLISIFLISSISAAVGALSEARVQSNFFGFDEAWIVDFVSDDFTTDRINAFFTPDDFENTGGDRTKQSLNISAQTKPSSCQWSLKEDFSTKPDVFIYIPISFTDWAWNDEELETRANQECASFRIGTTRAKENFFTPLIDKIWCVKTSTKLGTVGEFINPFIVAETDWTVQASGKQAQTATISNSEIGDGRSSQVGSRVFVQWQGLAGTGESCPLTQNNIPIHSNSFLDGWRVANEGNYDSYKNYVESSLMDDIFDWATGSLTETQLKNTASSIANNAIISSNAFGSFSVLNPSVSSGKIKVDLGRLIVFPQFRLIIDADYLELDIPTGEPKIISSDNLIRFTEGSAGSFSVTIKNIGSGRGGFTTRIISCTEGFSSNTNPQGSVLDPDEEERLTFEIIGSTTSSQATLSGSCTVEVKESITGKIDTKTFNTELTQIRECPPPEFACGVEGAFHVVKKCNSQGTGFEIKEICKAEEICKEIVGGAECRAKDDNGGFENKCKSNNAYVLSKLFGGIFDSLSCTPTLLQILAFIPSLIRFLLVPILFIFALIFSFNFFRTSKIARINNKGINVLVSLVIAGLIAVLVWFFFWIGLILFTILFLLWIFLRRFIPKGPRRKIEKKCKEGFKQIGNACVKK